MSGTRSRVASGATLEVVLPGAEEPRPALVPQDLRLGNLRRLLQELQASGVLSRAELARRTGMAVPTIHRLMSDLQRSGLVEEQALTSAPGRLGRPPTVYRFRRDAGVVAGVDVGNGTTRIALADLAGGILASTSMPTSPEPSALVQMVGDAVHELLRAQDAALVGAGVGIAAVVHPETGVLCNPPQHVGWTGLPLGERLGERLGCDVFVQQDDHLAALAECSSAGTAPAAASLLVLQIGKGIGVGLALDGRSVSGSLGRLGRIARWPVTGADSSALPGRTLGATLPTDGLVAQYRLRGGDRPVVDGATLALEAREGDAVARAVLAWTAAEIADVLDRLDALLAPEVVVLGGGLSGSFEALEPTLRSQLHADLDLRPSVLGDQAVVAGAVLSGSTFLEGWLTARLQRT